MCFNFVKNITIKLMKKYKVLCSLLRLDIIKDMVSACLVLLLLIGIFADRFVPM